MNELASVPASVDNTFSTIKLLVEIFQSQPKEAILPKSWERKVTADNEDAIGSRTVEESDSLLQRVNYMSSKLSGAVSELGQIQNDFERAGVMVQRKYHATLRQLNFLAKEASESNYRGPEDVQMIFQDMYEEIEAKLRFELERKEMEKEADLVVQPMETEESKIESGSVESNDSDSSSVESSEYDSEEEADLSIFGFSESDAAAERRKILEQEMKRQLENPDEGDVDLLLYFYENNRQFQAEPEE